MVMTVRRLIGQGGISAQYRVLDRFSDTSYRHLSNGSLQKAVGYMVFAVRNPSTAPQRYRVSLCAGVSGVPAANPPAGYGGSRPAGISASKAAPAMMRSPI